MLSIISNILLYTLGFIWGLSFFGVSDNAYEILRYKAYEGRSLFFHRSSLLFFLILYFLSYILTGATFAKSLIFGGWIVLVTFLLWVILLFLLVISYFVRIAGFNQMRIFQNVKPLPYFDFHNVFVHGFRLFLILCFYALSFLINHPLANKAFRIFESIRIRIN